VLRLLMVLGLVAIVTLLVAPTVTDALDRIAHEDERRSLSALSAALKDSIVRQRTIPTPEGMGAALALELGVTQERILRNSRSRERAFVLHPEFTRAMSLPYRQDWRGLRTLDPDRTRLVLVSCLARDLPEALSAGISVEEFEALWGAPASVYPPTWQSEGAWHDFQIERLNLADLFVEVRLRGEGGGSSRFRLDESGGTEIRASGGEFRAHYLKGSVLKLYDENEPHDILSITAVLGSPASFVCRGGQWSRERLHTGRRARMQGHQGSGSGSSTGRGATAPSLHDG
jgi:type II secretory pathway pseudopilin PulG